jgi:hypothetical protein
MTPVSDDRNRKQRACRARLARKRGEVVASIVIEDHAVIEALLRSGPMTDDQALRRSHVARRRRHYLGPGGRIAK